MRLPADVQGTDGFFEARLREDPGARGFWIWRATLAGGTEVGFGGFNGRPEEDGSVTLDYSVHGEHRRHGYGTEIAELLTEWALAQPAVTRVRATIRPGNAASVRVIERAGFEATGETVEHERQGTLLVFARKRIPQGDVPKLVGPRLTLTALDAGELEAIRWDPVDEDARAFFVAQLRADPDARGWWAWVARLADGEEVGSGGFGGRPEANRRLTVGYAIHEEHRGRGYATELLELLSGWALSRPEIDLVRATIRPDNVASIRVAEKAGFTRTADVVQDDEHGELLVFVRSREPS